MCFIDNNYRNQLRDSCQQKVFIDINRIKGRITWKGFGNQKWMLSKKSFSTGNSFQVDMADCYSTSQFYHKPVRSCFILSKKKHQKYVGVSVSQTYK